MRSRIVIVSIVSVLLGASGLLAEEDYQKDSAEGLPPEYAKNYLIARNTVSPDQKFGVIYPTLEFSESKEAKDLFVALNPFKVLAPLPTKYPYFQNQNHGGIGADWDGDGNAALITLDGKWGPRDVFLVELANDKVKRVTNLLEKTRELLRPKFQAAKPKPDRYNGLFEFIFDEEEGGACNFEPDGIVRVYTKASNDPKGISKRPWRVLVDAKWDMAKAKFVSQKITNEK
jgi:hypothetical protein